MYGVVVGIYRADPLVHPCPALWRIRLQRGRRKQLLDIGDDGARLVEHEIAVPQDRHPVKRMQRKVLGRAHIGLEVLEGVRRLLMRQHQPRDVHEGAVREPENRNLSHWMSPLRLVLRVVWSPRGVLRTPARAKPSANGARRVSPPRGTPPPATRRC